MRGRQWTPEEDERLRRLRAEGWSYAAIAGVMRRSKAGIAHRATNLGLPQDILDIVREIGGLHNLALSESEYDRARSRKEFVELYAEHRRRIVYLTPEALSQPLPDAAPMLPNGKAVTR